MRYLVFIHNYVRNQSNISPIISLIIGLNMNITPNRIPCQIKVVRCPGHTIHFLGYGYEAFVAKVLELSNLSKEPERRLYESWSPYRLQGAKET